MNVLVISGRLSPSDVEYLCERAQRLVTDASDRRIYCDVGGVIAPDVAAVEALARLSLEFKRLGYQVRLLHVHRDLEDLIDLVGLCDAMPSSASSAVEPGRKPEQRKHPSRVEEEADAADGSV